eukprot:g7733.t1
MAEVSGMLAEEQRFGHGFLFFPVALGLGIVLWFSAARDPPVWPLFSLMALLWVLRLAVGTGVPRFLVTTVCLVVAGMVLAQLETWRRSTTILDAAVTTNVVGVVERGEMLGPGRWRYVISLNSTANPTLHRPPQQVTLIARSRSARFENGVLIAGRARLAPPSGPALPGLFDFAFSAYFDGIGAVGFFYGAPKQLESPLVSKREGLSLERWIFDLRAAIGNRIRALAPGDPGAFAAAIVTDERRAISEETIEALRVAGLAHVVAISGLNMALAAGIFFVGLRTLLALSPGLAQALPVKKIAATGALAMVTGYYLISGFGVSAQRAYIMMAVMLVAVLLDRPSISLRNVALSALIIVAWSPSEILGPSFQMSFAATTALVAGYALWSRQEGSRSPEPAVFAHPIAGFAAPVWRFAAGVLMTSVIGSLSTAMFSVEHFHRIAVYGLAANLAAMPIISFVVMPAGLAAMLMMPFGLDGIFVQAMATSLAWVIEIAKLVASWGGDLNIGRQHGLFLPIGVVGFLLMMLLRTRLRLAGLPFLCLSLFLFWLGPERIDQALLVSEDGRLLALQQPDLVAVNIARPPAFIFEQWYRSEKLGRIVKPRPLDPAGTAANAAERTPLAAKASADARLKMKQEAGRGQFTCATGAWCSAVAPGDVLVVAVEDGRYAGIACDVADLVIAPRARFLDCRSGAPLLTAATLRKTGALRIDFNALEGGFFVVNQGDHDISRIGAVSIADDHRVAIQDAGLDHRVTLDLERVVLTRAEHLGGDGDLVGVVLDRGDRHARRDPSHHRNAGRAGRLFGRSGFWRGGGCKLRAFAEAAFDDARREPPPRLKARRVSLRQLDHFKGPRPVGQPTDEATLFQGSYQPVDTRLGSKARDRLSRLGFTVAPVASHPFGTANACVFFDDGLYLEPLAVADRRKAGLAAKRGNVFTERDLAFRGRRNRQGLSAIALASDDAPADHQRYLASGVSAGGLLEFSRTVLSPDGDQSEASFQLAFAAAQAADDFFAFSCQRLRPLPADLGELLVHANAVSGVQEVVLCSPEPSAAAPFMEELFQSQALSQEDAIVLAAGRATIRVVPPERLHLDFGVQPDPTGLRLSGQAVVFATADLAVTEIILAANDVAFIRREGRVLVSPAPGPCQMESRDHAFMVAGVLKELTDELGISLVYKSSFDKANRTSLSGRRGIGLDAAMQIFAELKQEFGFPVLTDIHTEEQCALVAPTVDVLQIPAFLSRQTDLLVAAARTGRAINVKKGQFLAPWDMKNVLAKFTESGNPNVLLCERGASFGYNTLVSDMRSLPIMASLGSPVIFDATHSVQQPGGQGGSSGGQREFVETLARAAVAVGVAGVFIETHEDPDNAPSDGPNMVHLKDMRRLLEKLLALDAVAKA